MLRALRVLGYVGPVCSDATYALDIVHGDRATIELALVSIARREDACCAQRGFLAVWHTPGHVGYPPNELADACARMGRLTLILPLDSNRVLYTWPPAHPYIRPKAVLFSRSCTCLDGHTGRA